MNSYKINLIDYEDKNNNSQTNFLNDVFLYFKNINLVVESPHKLRILGNSEFNEGHYSRACYLYRKANHQTLSLISEVFYFQEILDEEINSSNTNTIELNNLSNEIVIKTSELIKIKENIGLEKYVQNDENSIDITIKRDKISLLRNKIYDF